MPKTLTSNGSKNRDGITAVVCGLTPYNLGGPDEYIELDDLHAVAYMHTLAAFDFLSASDNRKR